MSEVVPFDRPLTQFRECTMSSHPEIPPVRAFKNIMQYAQHAVVLIVNTCTSDCDKHRNPLRILYYNVMSANNWKNPVFLETVELALNIGFLFVVERKFNTEEDCIRNAVRVACTMMASKTATEHPTIAGSVPPNIRNDVQSNVSQLIEVKKKIASSMNSDGSYNAINNWGSGGNNSGWGSGTNSSSGWGQSTDSGWGASNTGWSNGSSSNWGSSNSSSNWGSGTSSSNGWGQSSDSGWGSIAGNSQQSRELTPEEMTCQRLTTSPPPPPPAPAPINPPQPPAAQAPAPAPKTARNTVTPLITDGKIGNSLIGNEMDRAKHKILVLGQEANGVKAYEGWRDATPQLSASSAKTKDATYLHPAILTEASLDNTIAYAKTHALAAMPESSIYTPYRVFGVYMERLTTMFDQGDALDQLKNSTSLNEVSLRLGNLAKASGQSTTSERGKRAHIAFLHAINNQFTKTVNYWLTYRAGLPKVKIESFMDDWKDLNSVLERKYQAVADCIAAGLEDPLISLLENSKSIEDKLRSAEIIGIDSPENIYEYFIPCSCSITYSPMLQCEVGYKVTAEPSIIEADKFPVLWDTVNSLVKHQKEINIKPLVDLLVTADQAVYHIGNSVVRRGENYIFRP